MHAKLQSRIKEQDRQEDDARPLIRDVAQLSREDRRFRTPTPVCLEKAVFSDQRICWPAKPSSPDRWDAPWPKLQRVIQTRP